VTCYIELPDGYTAADIDPTTLLLNEIVPVDWYGFGDYDADGIIDLTAKFSRELVQETLGPGSTVPVLINGSGINELFTFKGMDVIKVLGRAGPKKGIPDSTEPLPEIVLEDTVIRNYAYYHLDHLGTPLAMTDSNGTIVWQADYDPFGGLATLSGTELNNFRFPGQYYDNETGLHYNWHRYYNPETGRYITPDPIGLAGGINLYMYANGNPIRFTDPRGLEALFGGAEGPFGPNDLQGPFGPRCGPEGRLLATHIPDNTPGACFDHDQCYANCAENCLGLVCKHYCDHELMMSNPLYGIATYLLADPVYLELERRNGCDECQQ
jgi:RHS repeat-associated protein